MLATADLSPARGARASLAVTGADEGTGRSEAGGDSPPCSARTALEKCSFTIARVLADTSRENEMPTAP